MPISARDALAVLHEAGIDAASAPALAWLLVAVDALTLEQVAAALGIERDSVRVYLWRVNRRIRQHDAAHALALAEADLEPDPEAPREELQAAARALLACVDNRPVEPDHPAEAAAPPLVSVYDACRIIEAGMFRRRQAET
jgi:DNA-directed RNA polymerase specialized sigma24 family protein